MRRAYVGDGVEGFTLLETLVALMVLASAMIVFSKTISTGILQMSGSARLQSAMLLSEKLLAQTQAASSDGALTGVDTETGLEWQAHIQPIHDNQPAGQDALNLVTFDIFIARTATPIYRLRTVLTSQAER